MKNITNLSKEELINVEGGSFGFDVGWFFANALVGNFSYPAGQADAFMDYAVYYATQ